MLLFAEFMHGFIFNLLYKAVHGGGGDMSSSSSSNSSSSAANSSGGGNNGARAESASSNDMGLDFVTSLAVHLLELAVTFPQKEGFSGKVC